MFDSLILLSIGCCAGIFLHAILWRGKEDSLSLPFRKRSAQERSEVEPCQHQLTLIDAEKFDHPSGAYTHVLLRCVICAHHTVSTLPGSWTIGQLLAKQSPAATEIESLEKLVRL